MTSLPPAQDILIVGNDRISAQLLHELGKIPNLAVYRDATTSIPRVIRLVAKRTLRLSDIAKMALAESRRPSFPQAKWIDGAIAGNDELLDVIQRLRPRRIFLFRAGLIVNRRVLSTGAVVMNFHCASIKTHGGLGSIRRALEDGAFNQNATLHRVTSAIDQGEVIAEFPYRLDPSKPYYWNEDVAYQAGIRLACRVLRDGNIPKVLDDGLFDNE